MRRRFGPAVTAVVVVAGAAVAAAGSPAAAAPAPTTGATAGGTAVGGRQVEVLDRGLISIRTADGNFVSWRRLAGDPAGLGFTVYRDGAPVTGAPLTGATNWLDKGAPAGADYEVRAAVAGAEQAGGRSAPSMRFDSQPEAGGSGLAGYDVYREQGASDPLLGRAPAGQLTLTGLTPSTQYQVYVRARDGAGNLSAASGTVTFTTSQGGTGGTCRVSYQAEGWGGSSGGFTANVTVTNTGASTINGWTLAFSFTGGQRVSDGWGATWAQPTDSADVTAVNQSWNAVLAPNSAAGIGFNASFSGSNPAPAGFTLNGTACS